MNDFMMMVYEDRELIEEMLEASCVHFVNLSSGGDFYDLFSGATYSPSAVASRHALPSGSEFETPAVDSSSTVIFSPVSGLPDGSLTIKIYLTGSPSVSSTIIVNQNGQIIY